MNNNILDIYEENIVKQYELPNREECPICIDNDNFTYKSWIRIKKCSHYFHRHCINLWLEQKTTCPVCVQNVYPDNYTITIHNNNIQVIANSSRYNNCCSFICFIFSLVLLFSIIFYINK